MGCCTVPLNFAPLLSACFFVNALLRAQADGLPVVDFSTNDGFESAPTDSYSLSDGIDCEL